MRLLLFALLAALSWALSPSASKRTLVILDDSSLELSHSAFFEQLRGQGHRLVFREALDQGQPLSSFGTFHFDNLILFAPKSVDLVSTPTEAIREFIDSGRSALIVTDETTSEIVRKVAFDLGFLIDESGVCCLRSRFLSSYSPNRLALRIYTRLFLHFPLHLSPVRSPLLLPSLASRSPHLSSILVLVTPSCHPGESSELCSMLNRLQFQ